MSTAWERMFDPRYLNDSQWRQRDDIDETRGQVDTIEGRVMAMQKQIHDLSVTVMALVELLTEDGKFTQADLKARVQAVLIDERDALRSGEGSLDAASSAWDSLKK